MKSQSVFSRMFWGTRAAGGFSGWTSSLFRRAVCGWFCVWGLALTSVCPIGAQNLSGTSAYPEIWSQKNVGEPAGNPSSYSSVPYQTVPKIIQNPGHSAGNSAGIPTGNSSLTGNPSVSPSAVNLDSADARTEAGQGTVPAAAVNPSAVSQIQRTAGVNSLPNSQGETSRKASNLPSARTAAPNSTQFQTQPLAQTQPEPQTETLEKILAADGIREEIDAQASLLGQGRGAADSAAQSSVPSGTQSEANSGTPSNILPETDSLFNPVSWVSPGKIQGSVSTFLFLSVVSLAPAFIMMTTSFVRIFVVLGILRHGFGTQGIPGTQILAALALFMTFFIMHPTWERTWTEGVEPYQSGELTAEEAWEAGVRPLRGFMTNQLERTGNTEEILLFWRSSSTPPDESKLAEYTSEDIPLHVLLPAFMLSELKTAFLIGVQILIPMLVIDLLVSAVLVSMGMFMLPPTLVSLPFKLLLFVLADGWRLTVEMLLTSFLGT